MPTSRRPDPSTGSSSTACSSRHSKDGHAMKNCAPLLALLAALGCAQPPDDVASDSGTMPDAGVADGRTAADSGGGQSCTAAKDKLLVPIDTVSTGEVLVLSDMAGVKRLYVDAAAGGIGPDASNPRLYLDLTTGARVAVTDRSAATSTAWDLSLKRPVLFTNSGDGGPGQGGAVYLDKAF